MKKSILLMLSVVLVLSMVMVSCGGETYRYEGTVRDEFTHETIKDVEVTFNGTTAKTNDEGMFAFEGISKDEYEVKVAKNGYEEIFFTVKIDKDFFEEIALLPSDSADENSSDNSPLNENKPTEYPDPIPPGELLSSVPGLKFLTGISNYKANIGIAPESVTTKELLTIYVDGKRQKIVHKNPSDDIEISEILDGDTVYMYDPQFDGWMKETIEGLQSETPTQMIETYFEIINSVLSMDGVQVSKLDPILLHEKSYDRFYISGVAENVKQSFNGEVYVDDGIVMGFDAKIADGKYSNRQEPIYLLLSEIGNVGTIELPTNVKEFDMSEPIEMPEPVPVDPSQIPPISETEKDR